MAGYSLKDSEPRGQMMKPFTHPTVNMLDIHTSREIRYEKYGNLMSYYEGWAPYVSVAERRKKAEKAAAKAIKAGKGYAPVASFSGAIGKTFWGKAWCKNLEGYSDLSNRLPRGRSYARNGSIIDLKISDGAVQAQVMGSSLYQVAIKITAVPKTQWQAISADCAGSIDTLVELLQGKLSKAVMERICTPRTGLFPAPKEISFTCSCPDWASMCKHVAATLYAVGVRLDQQPELLFSLRRVDAKDLVNQAGAGLSKAKKAPRSSKVLDNAMLADVFGIEMDTTAVPAKKVSPQKKTPPAKNTAKKPAKITNKKSVATRKTASVKKTVVLQPSARNSSNQRKTKTSLAQESKLPGTKVKTKKTIKPT
jgi:uncharacterized Zn finger protein